MKKLAKDIKTKRSTETIAHLVESLEKLENHLSDWVDEMKDGVVELESNFADSLEDNELTSTSANSPPASASRCSPNASGNFPTIHESPVCSGLAFNIQGAHCQRIVSGAAGPGGAYGYPAQFGITDGAAGPGGTVGPDPNFGVNRA